MATKTLTAAALLLGLSFTAAFAGTPKTDAKADAKAPAKVEATTPTQANTKASNGNSYDYFVVGEETAGGINYYDVQTSDPGCKSTGLKPCEVISSQQMDGSGRIVQTSVTSTISHQDSYN